MTIRLWTLIYLDQPFNSRQDYNVLFAERSDVGPGSGRDK